MIQTAPARVVDESGAKAPARRLGLWLLALGTPLAVGIVVTSGVIQSRPAVALENARPAAALSVTDAAARHETWPSEIETSGDIVAWQEASIGAKVGGYSLVEVNVNVGDKVKRGQVLARFDADMLLAEEAQLKASLAQAELQAAQAGENLKRAQALRETGNLSEQDFQQYRTQAATASAQADSNRALLDAKKLQIRYTEVAAPDDGTISSRAATLGAVVPAGQQLFTIILQDRLEWRGELTAQHVTRIVPGQQVSLALPDGSAARGVVRQTAPSLSSQSRMGTVYADLESGGNACAGMYASGRIALAQTPALVLPAACVVIRDGRSYVARILEDGQSSKVTLLAVAVGRRGAAEVEILRGLNEGDRVVSSGAGFLNEGDLVNVLPGPLQASN